MTEPNFGLCSSCVFQRTVPTTRGTSYSLCERSQEDPRFRRYPRTPVAVCAGYLPRADISSAPNRPNDE
ncbi:MAG: hypothetical protein WCJ50_04360 [Actinomycetes bacterium]